MEAMRTQVFETYINIRSCEFTTKELTERVDSVAAGMRVFSNYKKGIPDNVVGRAGTITSQNWGRRMANGNN